MLRFWPRGLTAALLAALWISAAWAAANLPALTGRVVDDAHILSPVTIADTERKLADLDQKSGIQFVVATVPSLGGEEIEPYANELFRTWKLGEAKKNNGVLLLVAPKERRVRIEVGYGLEGTLTDAASTTSSQRSPPIRPSGSRSRPTPAPSTTLRCLTRSRRSSSFCSSCSC